MANVIAKDLITKCLIAVACVFQTVKKITMKPYENCSLPP